MQKRSSQVRIEAPTGIAGRREARLVEAEELRGWLPVDAVVEGGRPLLRWLDMRGARLAEPFFWQTVERVRREGRDGSEVFTDFEALMQVEKVVEGPRPDGFIFHSSRCGSTLVSNACRALDGAIVVSEAAPLDQLIWPYLAGGEGSLKLLRRIFLRALVNILGQRRLGDERRYFIKFSCCSVLRLSFIRSVWQDVPWVFVHRDPVEVLVSNLRSRPEWMSPLTQPALAQSVCGVSAAEAASFDGEEFCARALGNFYAAAARDFGPRAMLVGYEELSTAKLLEIVRFFGVAPVESEAARVASIIRLYAKDATPARPFAPDGGAKRAAATTRAREMVARWAAGPYLKLLARRPRPTEASGSSALRKRSLPDVPFIQG